MRELLWVAAGGAVGASLRYGAGVAAAAMRWHPTLSTLAVNVIGGGLIGLLAAVWLQSGSAASPIKLGVQVGVLGGLTTFSAFSLQTLSLLQAGAIGQAGLNVAANVLLSLMACWAGFALGQGLS